MSWAAYCPGCGRGPEPALTELASVDSQIGWRRAKSVELRKSLGLLERETDELVHRRVGLVAYLEGLRRAAAPTPVPAPARVPAPGPPPVWAPGPVPGHAPEAASPPAPPRPEASTRSIQNILLILGGVLSAAAVIVFTVVAWATFGAVGRAAILLAITAVMAAVPLWLRRKGLSATAETLSGLAILMLGCDGFALRYLRVIPPVNNGSQASHTITNAMSHGVNTPMILFGCVAVTAFALGYRMVTRMLVPGFAVVVAGAATLVLGYVQTRPLPATAALALLLGVVIAAAWLFERFPAHQGRRASRLLTQVSGGLAVVTGIGLLSFGLSGSWINGWPIHQVAPLAIGVAAAVVYCPRLPRPWRPGPMYTAYVASGLVGAGAAAIALAVAVRWTWRLLPVWHFGSHHGASGVHALPSQTLVALAVLTIAMGSVEWIRRRWWLIACAITLCVLVAPAALGLDWVAAAVFESTAAVVAALIAATGPPAAVRAMLALGGAAFAYALVLANGGERASLVVLGALTVALVAVGAIALRGKRGMPAGLMFGTALWTGLGAVPSGLHLSGMTIHHLTPVWMLAVALALVAVSAGLATVPLVPPPDADTASDEQPSEPDAEAAAPPNPGAPAVSSPALDADPLALAWRLYLLPGLFLAVITATVGGLALGATGYASPVVVISAVAMPVAAYALLPVTARATRPRLDAAVASCVAAALAGIGGVAAAWWPHESLFAYTGASIVVGLLATALPRKVSRGTSWGAAIVGVASTALSGLIALSCVPVMWGLTPSPPWLDWRTPFILALAGLASLALLPPRWRTEAAYACAALAVVAVPATWRALLWWVGPSLVLAVACGYAWWSAYATSRGRAGRRIAVAGAWAAYAITAAVFNPFAPNDSAAYSLTARLGLVLVVVCGALAVAARARQPIIGGVSVSCAVALLPGVLVMAGLADSWPAQRIQLAAMMAACAGLLVAGLLRVAGSPYLAWATIVVPTVATACARAGIPSEQSPMYAATAGLIGVGAGMLMLPNRRAAAIRAGLSCVSILATFASVIWLPLVALGFPYRGVLRPWTSTPSHTLDALGSRAAHLAGEPLGLAVLAIGSGAVVLAILGLAGRRGAAGVSMVALALVVPSLPVVLDLPWPTLPYVTVAVAIAAYLLCVHVRLRGPELIAPVAVAAIAGGAAIAGSLTTSSSTVGVLALSCAAAFSGALAGAGTARRVVGWLLASGLLSGLVIAMGYAVHLPTTRVALGAIAVSVVLLAVASLRGRATGVATWAAELGGHLAALPALGLAAWFIPRLSVVLVIYGAVLGLLAVRAPLHRERGYLLWHKRGYALSATAAALAAYWLLLFDTRVSTIETYTVPFALLTILGGWLELRRRPSLRSWIAYGPGLCLGLLPTLALILISPDEPLRRLLLGAASMAILLLGTWRRLQAPVVAAGIVLTVQALREMSLLWLYVSSWVPLGIGGFLLLLVGGTFERRRREMAKVRRVVAAMR
ncbi:MAG TPA: hypothetical protein VE172_14565 [Stackebrandtia sp.]|uniref:SCO7613 C-terminal domain-containing membrane protein n=1 Tax=Stackebrandtia sp. TaxID=2023065 RepID=UPI002D4F980E|nr:hypothetical protein [Stackebrandtia sp.]HZE40026.1 hypothetical protein [Stackebrandtia sp.]